MAEQPLSAWKEKSGESHPSKTSLALELQMGYFLSADGVINLVARSRPEEQLRECHVVELSLELE